MSGSASTSGSIDVAVSGNSILLNPNFTTKNGGNADPEKIYTLELPTSNAGKFVFPPDSVVVFTFIKLTDGDERGGKNQLTDTYYTARPGEADGGTQISKITVYKDAAAYSAGTPTYSYDYQNAGNGGNVSGGEQSLGDGYVGFQSGNFKAPVKLDPTYNGPIPSAQNISGNMFLMPGTDLRAEFTAQPPRAVTTKKVTDHDTDGNGTIDGNEVRQGNGFFDVGGWSQTGNETFLKVLGTGEADFGGETGIQDIDTDTRDPRISFGYEFTHQGTLRPAPLDVEVTLEYGVWQDGQIVMHTATFTIPASALTIGPNGFSISNHLHTLSPIPAALDPDNARSDSEIKLVSVTTNFVNGQSVTTTPNQYLDVTCFLRGTMIDTPDGPRAIEDLQIGDLVMTRDHGAQPIRWIGGRPVSTDTLAAHPKLRPIRIACGALGVNMPARDLLVSPQHRMLVSSRIAQRMTGEDEVLVPAIRLVGMTGITIAEDLDQVEYFHMLFDRHEVVYSNGAPSESLFTGPMALRSLAPEAIEEIFTLFPELRQPDHQPVPARQLVQGRIARKLVERHQQNQRALLELVA